MKVGTALSIYEQARNLILNNSCPISELVEKVYKAGASHIEFSCDLFYCTENFRNAFKNDIKNLVNLGKKFGITYSLHLPYIMGMEISSFSEDIRQASINQIRQIVEDTLPLNITHYVMHENMLEYIERMSIKLQEGAYSYLDTAVRSIFSNILEKSLKFMKSFLNLKKLCIENQERGDLSILDSTIAEFDLGICCDFPHLLMRGESVTEFVKKYKSKIKAVHIHDVKEESLSFGIIKREDHHQLGTGNLNIEKILNLLKGVGFNGPIVIEDHLAKDPVESIRILNESINKILAK